MTTVEAEARINGATSRWRKVLEVERCEGFVKVLYQSQFYHVPPERVRPRRKPRTYLEG